MLGNVDLQKFKDRSVESYWIPTDPMVWKIDKYEVFLEIRRQLLADAANDLLVARSN